MTDRFSERVAVITGGAGGMGLATVLRFLDEGASGVVGDLNTDRGAALLAAAEADGSPTGCASRRPTSRANRTSRR